MSQQWPRGYLMETRSSNVQQVVGNLFSDSKPILSPIHETALKDAFEYPS